MRKKRRTIVDRDPTTEHATAGERSPAVRLCPATHKPAQIEPGPHVEVGDTDDDLNTPQTPPAAGTTGERCRQAVLIFLAVLVFHGVAEEVDSEPARVTAARSLPLINRNAGTQMPAPVSLKERRAVEADNAGESEHSIAAIPEHHSVPRLPAPLPVTREGQTVRHRQEQVNVRGTAVLIFDLPGAKDRTKSLAVTLFEGFQVPSEHGPGGAEDVPGTGVGEGDHDPEAGTEERLPVSRSDLTHHVRAGLRRPLRDAAASTPLTNLTGVRVNREDRETVPRPNTLSPSLITSDESHRAGSEHNRPVRALMLPDTGTAAQHDQSSLREATGGVSGDGNAGLNLARKEGDSSRDEVPRGEAGTENVRKG